MLHHFSGLAPTREGQSGAGVIAAHCAITARRWRLPSCMDARGQNTISKEQCSRERLEQEQLHQQLRRHSLDFEGASGAGLSGASKKVLEEVPEQIRQYPKSC